MSVVSHIRKVAFFTLFSLVVTSSSYAQQQPKQETFSTEDGVLIHATWYQSPKGSNSPVALILHDFGSNRSKTEWVNLATELQKNDISVLTFDFRGHGESVTAEPKFWNVAANRLSKAPMNGKLNFNDFDKKYRSYLINDIAAAKAFLDLKNDTGQCNSSSLILIGAGEGSALGSVWLNSEWYRHEFLPPIGFNPAGPNYNHVYGQDVVACVWLSYINRVGADLKKNNPGGVRLDPKQLFARSAIQNNTPMLFFYNPNDSWDKIVGPYHEKLIKDNAVAFNNKLTLAVPIKNANKLKGRELLQGALGTSDAIIEYLTKAPIKTNVWTNHNFKGTQYLWVFGPAVQQWVQVNQPGSKTLGFHDYSRFMPK